MIAKITEQMLKKAPDSFYQVVHTATLARTLETLKTNDFDVILLDLNLGDSRELETVTRVIEAAPGIPIIVLTATATDEIGVKAVQMGAQDFLLKGDFNYLTLDRAIVYAIERHRLQRTIRQLAVLDELTGLYNRRGFNQLHLDILQRIKSSESRGYLIYFDLDRFKHINDVLGHAIGDEALKEFAAVLRRAFRKDSLLVRLGGDEFVAMGIEHLAGEVEGSLATLQELLADRNAVPDAPFQLLSSAGAAFFGRTNALSVEELGKLADAALYENKQNRRRNSASRAPEPLATEEIR